MILARALCVAVLVVGCSSPSEETAPAPVAYGFETLGADVRLDVLANAGAERLVDGNFAVGHVSPFQCTKTEVVDGCQIEVCTRNGVSAPGTVIDPGTVTATSPSLGNSVPLTIAENGLARLLQQGDFAAGEVVHIAATGSASFPAFDVAVRVPTDVTALSFGNCGQDPNPREPKTCTLSEPPIAKWSGGDEIVLVRIVPSLDSPAMTSVECAFDARAGAGKIPASAFSRLAAGEPHVVGMQSAPRVVSSGRVAATARRWPRGRVTPVLLPK